MPHVSSAEDISAVSVAVQICNNPELKREIFCVPWSHFNIYCKHYVCGNKSEWDKAVETKSTTVLENLGLPMQLQEKVIGIIMGIGMRMLAWASYHEGILGLSREHSVNFLNSSFFTQQGIIDNRKAAEELMKDKSLNIYQRYKLACIYCFADHVPALFGQMTKKDIKRFYIAQKPERIMQPGLVTFWSYYLMGEIDELKKGRILNNYLLEKAIESGCKTAVEYCLGKEFFLRQYDPILIDATLEAVRNRATAKDDSVIFHKTRYCFPRVEPCIPRGYFMDTLCFLLWKMNEDQLVEFLKEDIESVMLELGPLGNRGQSRILQYFLNWPYQNYFMKTAKLMWEFLPENDYADLLLKICDKLEPEVGALNYGEERSFDYRKLLREFWQQSPERYKRYVFNDEEIVYKFDEEIMKGTQLLIKLFKLQTFTNEDRQNIELILGSATDEEKESIITSKEGRNIIIDLMSAGKWKVLDVFILNCFSSKEQSDEFKREFSFTFGSLRTCVDFVLDDKWDKLESFIKWSTLCKESLIRFKMQLICSGAKRSDCILEHLTIKNSAIFDRIMK